jgi:hypothetical protein
MALFAKRSNRNLIRRRRLEQKIFSVFQLLLRHIDNQMIHLMFLPVSDSPSWSPGTLKAADKASNTIDLALSSQRKIAVVN